MASLRAGLPARFSDPETGFRDLCRYLNIPNRQYLQRIASRSVVKDFCREQNFSFKGLKTAERLRAKLTAYYSDPQERREVWGLQRDLPDLAIPGIERQAFRDLGGVPEDHPEEERIRASLEGIPGSERLFDDPQDWQRPGVALWPILREDLDRWEELEAERREAVALGVFSVATLFDSPELLRYAAGKDDSLQAEFAFALVEPAPEEEEETPAAAAEEESEAPEAGKEAGREAGREEEAEEEKPENIHDAEWNRAYGEFFDFVSAAGRAGVPLEGFEKTIRRVEALGRLRDSLAAKKRMAGVFAEYLVNLRDLLVREVRESGADWLQPKLREAMAQWLERHSPPTEAAAKAFRRDLKRLRDALPAALSEWKKADAETGAAEAERARLEGAAPAEDPAEELTREDRIVELQEKIAAASRRRINARRRVLRIIAPGGEAAGRAAPPPTKPSTKPTKSKKADRAPGAPAAAAEAEGKPEPAGDREPEPDPEPPKPGPGKKIAKKPAAPAAAAAATRPAPAPEPAPPPSNPHAEAVWQAIRDGRPGAATLLSRLAAARPEGSRGLPPPDLIEATALAGHLRAPDDDFAAALRPILEGIDPDDFGRGAPAPEDLDALHLLLLSATLAPALFAPTTGAPALLRQIHTSEPLAPVYTLARQVADYADRLHGTALDASLLQSALGTAGRERQLTELAQRVREWSAAVKGKTNPLPRAAQVLGSLLTGGCLAELTERISADRRADRPRVRQILQELGATRSLGGSDVVPREFEALVHQSDRRSGARPITDRALRLLWKNVLPAVGLANEWLQVMSGESGDLKGYLRDIIVSLRKDLDADGAPALAAVAGMEEAAPPPGLAAALLRARQAIAALLAVFEERTTDGAPAPRREIVRCGDLVLVSALDLDPDFRPRAPYDPESVLGTLLDRDRHAATRAEAFRQRLERFDLLGARLALESMEAYGDGEEAECRRALRESASERRFGLTGQLAAETSRIEAAFCQGRLGGDERNDLAARLVAIATALAEPPASPEGGEDAVVAAAVDAEAELRRIQDASRSLSAGRIEAARKRLAAAPEEADPRGVEAARTAIEAGHLLTAHEYLLQLEEGESFQPAPEPPSPFGDFRAVEAPLDAALPRYADRHGHRQVVDSLARRQGISGFSFRGLDEEQAKRGARLLEAWFAAAEKRAYDKHLLQGLLDELGFGNCQVSTDRGSRTYLGSVRVARLSDRDLCPSRQFGSEADGRYRLLLNWAPNVEETIRRSVGVSGDAPTIVLHFGCLGGDRERLRRLALRDQRLFLVLDTSFVVFLATQGAAGLSVLFRAALPFTSADPYAPTAGVVPPELFYGRERERRDLADRSGTCFIYGGRQLGKTALLRRVESEFRSSPGHLAKWLDLKVHEIGYAKGPREIWPLLHDAFADLKILRRPKGRGELDPANSRHLDALLTDLREWLGAREERRLLLLLDEADEFLARDAAADFRESARLKGLMDETGRRFKVVFAGLHNVLRTTRQANHPLAHLGDPVRVGPMLGGRDERRNAEALVRQPLEAVGCRFERDDLVHRILAQTNYYPSLIQLYGAELARRVRAPGKPFPYRVTDAELDGAYGSPELRDAIRERFLLTLQLDPRYEVIAYALAFESRDRPVLDAGLEREEIRRLARDWWPEGFRISDLEFRMLLDEMDGLGVLRVVGEDRYTLRNPNVLLLLGNAEQVEKTLEKPRSLPATYEPASFRARYPQEGPRVKRRGPLTYRQEDLLRRPGVAVISGCRAAGLFDVTAFLAQRSEQRNGADDFGVLEPAAADLDAFRRQLDGLPLDGEAVSVHLLPLEARWDAAWLDEARRFCSRRRAARVRLAFQADPDRLRLLAGGAGNGGDGDLGVDLGVLEGLDRIEIKPCDATFVRSWLDDVNLQHDEEKIRELLEVSGGWPVCLFELNTGSTKDWKSRMEELRKKAARTPSPEQLGLGADPEVAGLLQRLTEIEEPFSEETMELLAEEASEDGALLRRRVAWCERLGLVERTGDGGFSLNPLLRRRLLRPAHS